MPSKPFLNSKRLTYALITGALLWAGWLISILLGKGIHDAAGQVICTDFLAFYTGGKIVSDGQSANLYNLRFQHEVQQSIIGDEWPDLDLYVNPPFYAWLFVPFTRLPYLASALLWAGFGIAVIGLGVRWLGVPHPLKTFTWGLTFFPIFAGVSFGQNAPLSLALFCLVYTLRRRQHRFAAGLASSMLLYKPQLLIGLGLLWLLEWRSERKSLAGLALGGAGLVLISFGLTPQASLGYIRNSRFLLSDFPPWHAYATRTFWINLLPDIRVLPDVLYLLCVVIGLRLFFRFWQQWRGNQEILFGAAICLNLWITPHVMVYDWSLLLIPAIILWEQLQGEHPRLTNLYAFVWAAAFLSGPFTLAQLKVLPFAVQISVPILAIALLLIYRKLISMKSDDIPNNDYISP
jgi:alpha-1,2-mannosyltransferase